MIQTGFFTHEIQLRRLDQLGDSLKEVGEAIDFEMFRPSLASLLGVHTGVVGRKPLDQVFMFKILVLQVIRGLSDEALEFHLNDSASAQRFIGRSPCHRSLQNAPPVITSKCTTPDGCFLMD